MTSRFKRSLLLAGVALTIGAFFWSRALASWRPQKIATLPSRYEPQYISKDERHVITVDTQSTSGYAFKSFDLSTGQSWDWPTPQYVWDLDFPAFGWGDPFHWSLFSGSESSLVSAVELQDPLTRRAKHLLLWRNRDYSQLMDVKADAKTAQILTPLFFRVFDLSNDKMTREVKLQKPFPPYIEIDTARSSTLYAISADGRTLYGCLRKQGRVWRTSDGKLLKQWTLSAPSSVPEDPDCFSPDGHTLVFRLNLKWIFVDSTTGKIRWQKYVSVPLVNCFFPQENALIVPQKDSCEVRDVATGRLLRLLPGPRSSEPNILRVTSDRIYTKNLKGEILRWRAR